MGLLERVAGAFVVALLLLVGDTLAPLFVVPRAALAIIKIIIAISVWLFVRVRGALVIAATEVTRLRERGFSVGRGRALGGGNRFFNSQIHVRRSQVPGRGDQREKEDKGKGREVHCFFCLLLLLLSSLIL